MLCGGLVSCAGFGVLVGLGLLCDSVGQIRLDGAEQELAQLVGAVEGEGVGGAELGGGGHDVGVSGVWVRCVGYNSVRALSSCKSLSK